MARIKDLQVGQSAFVPVDSIHGPTRWVKAKLVANDSGEHMMLTVEGDRISFDGYEQIK